ncbi:hypothetical protein IFVP69_C1150105 [Vibrio parahaemolyticus]
MSQTRHALTVPLERFVMQLFLVAKGFNIQGFDLVSCPLCSAQKL